MGSERERWFSHWYFRLHIKNKPDEPLSLEDAFDIINQQKATGTADAVHKGARWITQLVAMDKLTNQGYVSLLFLGIDKERAQAVYGDIETLNLRTAKKNPTEGGAVSAHLLIRLASEPGLAGNYAILEEVEGLSKTSIVFYLRWLLDKYVTLTAFDAKSGKEVNIKSMLNDDIVLDKPIRDQLKSASLIAVDVYKKTRNSTIDRRVEYYEKTRLIEYRPLKKVKGAPASKIITKILGDTDKALYPEVRIRIEEAGGNERTVGGSRGKQDALLNAFQLRVFASDIHPALEEASKKMVEHVISLMKGQFPKLKP